MGGFARVAAFAALGGFLFGYDLAVIGGAIPFMQPELGLSEGEVELVVSAAKFGAVLATPLAGYVMLRYGRRPALALSAAAFCAGPGIMAVAPGLGLLTLGRLVVGLGIGLSAVASPAFLAEMAPAAMRGTVVSAYELMLCLGMVCAALMDYLLARVSTVGGGFGDGNWRLMLAVPAALGGLLACALSMLPESPRWLVSKGRMEDALAVIEQLRDSSTGSSSSSGSAAARGGGARRKRDHAAEVEQELLELWSAVEKEKAEALEASGIQLFTHTAVFDRASQRLVVSPGLGPVTRDEDGSVARGHGFVLRDALSPAGSWQELRAAWRELLHGPAAATLQAQPGAAAAAAGTPAPASAADEGDDAGAARAATAAATAAAAAAAGPAAIADAADDADGASAAREHAKQAARRPLVIVAWLALINQLTASTAIINYAPKIFEDLGVVDQGCVWEVAEEGGGALAAACAALPDKAACSAAAMGGDGAPMMQCAWEADRGQAALLAAGLGLAKLVGVGLTMYLGVLDGAGHGGGDGGDGGGGGGGEGAGAGAGRGKSSMLAACLCGAGGRRAVLIRGAVTQGLSMFALSVGVASGSAALVIASTLAFVLFFAASWAGAFWVVVSEAFSMRLKAVAAPLATALLFLFGALIDALFLSLVSWFGAFAFSIFGGVALAGGAYVHWYLPETQGCTLAEANRRYASDQRAEGATAGGAGGSLCGRRGGGNGQQRWESLREDGSLNDGLVAQDARQTL